MEINKKRILQGLAVGVIGTLTVGGLAGCVSEDPEGTFYTQDQIDTMISDAKADVKCAVCECETKICECPMAAECEICEICPEPVEVPVDNGNMDMVLKSALADNTTNFEMITKDLDEDDIDEVVDRFIFANDLKVSAEQLVGAEGLEFLDDEADEIFDLIGNENTSYRDSDVYFFDVDKDETVISEIHDFDDKEATVSVEVRMILKDGDDRDKVDVIFEVESNEDGLEIVDAKLKE